MEIPVKILMSTRSRLSRSQVVALASVLTIVLAPFALRAGSISTLTLNPDFETTNQSLWNTGPAAVGSLTYFVGASWDASGTIGKIKNTVVGKFGAQLSGSTSGQVGLGLSLEYNSGSLNADVKPTVSVSIPSQIVLGTPFAVSTSVTNTALGFSTVSPQAGLEVDADLTIHASGTGKVCVFGCVSKSSDTIGFSQQLEVLGINSNFDNKVVIFGQDVTSSVVNKAQISFGDPSTALTIAYDPGSGKIFPTFTTTSTQAAGQTVARATGSTNVLTLDVEVPNAITDLLELPGLNGSFLGGLINYNLISADVTLGLGWAQTQSLQYEGAEVALKVSAVSAPGVPGVADQTIDIGAGSTAEITLDPTVYKNVSQVTITPTVILNSPQFTAVNALQITEGISASAFSLSGLGLSLGPLWSWSQSWSQDVPLYTAKFGVAGFTNQSSAVLYGTASLLPRGSTADPVLYTVMGSGSLSDMTLETVDPSALSGNPGSAGYPTVLPPALTLTGSTLDNTGGDLVSNPSGTTLTLTNSGILGGTIEGSSLTLVATGASNQLVNVGYTGDLNVQGRLDLLWSAANTGNTGTVTVAPVAGSGVDAVLNVQGSQLGADSITITPNGTLNASMSVIGGSTVNVNTLNNAGTITVGGYWNAYTPAYPNDATGLSVNPTAIAGAAYDSITAANVTNKGLITIQSGVFDAQTVSNTGGVFSVVGMGGGTSSLVLHGAFTGGEIDLNGSGAQLLLGSAQMLGVNVYSDQGLISAGSNAGIAEQSTLTLTDGSVLAVQNGGSLTIDQSKVLADNSIIRVDGALTLQGSRVLLQDGSAILNDGSIIFLPTYVVDPILTDGSQVAIDNRGSVDVEDALVMYSSTADNPLILNESGTFHVDSNGLLALDVEGASGGALAYLQTGGVTQVDGTLLMQDQSGDPEYMVMTGGTLEGQGGIVGNVINWGGTVELSQDQFPLTIAGDYQQFPAGVMELVLSGAPDIDDHPELVVDTAELDGTLDLELPVDFDMTGYDPNNPWIYAFLECGDACSGEFSGLDWTGPDGYYWEVLYGDNSVEAELLQYAAGVGSSLVDPQTELDELQAQGGGTPPPLTLPNGPSLTINGGEFALSPEPATWTVAAAGLGALGIWLRRKKAGGR